MSDDRYVVLGLARPRTSWFSEVSVWCTAAILPVSYRKCLTVEEVRARLRSGRAASALLIDAGLPALDRDLVELARSRGCAVIAVGDRPVGLEATLGALVVLPPDFDHAALLDALASHALMVGGVEHAVPTPEETAVAAPWAGRLVSICGAGGTGASTLAAALAQGAACDARYERSVAVVDLALDADQAVLHGATDIVPGLLELVEAHRRGQPGTEAVRSSTFDVPDRGYRLLLGLRRHRDWVALRQQSVEAALVGLCQAFRLVVADTDVDLEGSAECGSLDVEDRNVLARSATARSDVVVLACEPDLKGLHAGVRSLRRLVDAGIDPGRVLTVFNRAPARPAARAELSKAFSELARAALPTVASPIFVPSRRAVEAAHRDGVELPRAVVQPLSRAVLALLDRLPRDLSRGTAPERIAPGSLGSWSGDEAVGA